MLSPQTQERFVVLAAVLLRLLVGLSSYSGAGNPPKYGDYEAQRHWMEVAVHLPPSEWYKESLYINGSYWPLDYPPLSGYQSYIHGKWLQAYEPEAVALLTSHGYETPSSKLLMRLTVVASDLLVFFPAALACVHVLYGPKPTSSRAFALAAVLLNPAAVIIDHGHFQFNCISMGFTVGAGAAIMNDADVLGSILFCLALNHKQMALYYAPAFFAHLLGKCLQQPTALKKAAGVLKLGVTVIATFSIIWYPWASDSPAAVVQVLHRIFPLKRGLYEDYVANFWCTTSVVLKWKKLLQDASLPPLCALITLTAALPSMAHQMMAPSPKGLLLAMANSAFAFFMFSYQVHEKSILLPLLPVTLLAAHLPATCVWLVPAAMASMYPLLERDGLAVTYAALLLLWCGCVWVWGEQAAIKRGAETSQQGISNQNGVEASPVGVSKHRQGQLRGWANTLDQYQAIAKALGLCGLIALHLSQATLPPPARLPWLYDRAFITALFVVLAAAACYLQVLQWGTPVLGPKIWGSKSKLL